MMLKESTKIPPRRKPNETYFDFHKKHRSKLSDPMKQINYTRDERILNWLCEKTDWQLSGWVSELLSFGFNGLPNFH